MARIKEKVRKYADVNPGVTPKDVAKEFKISIVTAGKYLEDDFDKLSEEFEVKAALDEDNL